MAFRSFLTAVVYTHPTVVTAPGISDAAGSGVATVLMLLGSEQECSSTRAL